MQVEIELSATLETPFSIGTGAMADSVADKPLVKDAAGRPFIPGSSLKGQVRHKCERIIRALVVPWPGRWRCEAPYPDRMCRGPDLCPICRIFGSPWHPAPITFNNLTLTTIVEEPPRDWEQLRSVRATDIRLGVGINRSRNVTAEELLYSTETYVPPLALIYRGRIWGTLEERREVALLLAGLRSVVALGGGRSRGLGWWRLEIAVKLDGQPVSVYELLQELDQWSS